MKIYTVFRTLGSVLLLVELCRAKRGFILASPKAIDAGSKEYFTFTAFDVPPGGVVSLKLTDRLMETTVLAESTINVISNLNMWIEMDIPVLSSLERAKLVVQGNFSDGYKINKQKEVLIRHNSVLTFVQTDKPLYKPSQTVRFRILPMDSQLRPLGPDTVGDIWIEDPTNIRIAQWKNVQFKEGMKQLKLLLSDEPPLGTWTINVKINGVLAKQNFNVEKYVLPKFEVTVKPPSYIMADAKTVPVEICAGYSYGKKIDGKLKVRVSYTEDHSSKKSAPTVEHSGLISGCYTLVVNTEDITLQKNQYGYKTIEFFAEVTENGTEITANATAAKKITHLPLNLKFLGSEGNTDYFKPGIPFYGQLQVLTPDNLPAPSEKIKICIRSNKLRIRHSTEVCQTFISDRNGRIQYILPPIKSSISKVILKAEAVDHPTVYYRGHHGLTKLQQPRATLELIPWYSPSSNYLQIQATPDELECEKLHRVKVRYTGANGASNKFYHQVISRGRIVQQGSHQRTFFPKDDTADRRYDFDPLSSTTEKHSWSTTLEINATASLLNETAPPQIGEFDLSFDPRATMSPVARLLIYYVRSDGEVVADSRKFRIAKCLLNKAKLHFRHEQQYPSTEASLLLSASPSSICGIGLVDKSVRFLKQDNQFKIDKIFEAMEKYDVGKTSAPFQVTQDYCKLGHSVVREESSEEEEIFLRRRRMTGIGNRRGDLIQRPLLDRPAHVLRPAHLHRPAHLPAFFPTRRKSFHADTIMAFEEAGMVVLSDFELETRPCTFSHPTPVAYRANSFKNRPLGLKTKARITQPKIAQPARHDPVPTETHAPIEEIRNFFPETWLWEMHIIGPSGETALQRQLPHTITQWVGGAVCVHPKTGLGISEDASITAFQPFFVAFRLPYSVVKDEIVPLVVTVFNYLTECLPIKLSLEDSDEYKILSDGRSYKMCVCGEKSAFHKFVIKPTTLGKVNITVYGYSIEDDDEVCGNEVTARLSARDAVSKQLNVEAEGFPQEETYNYYICPKTTNGSYATEIDLLLPEDVVEGSARAYATISGNLMAPALKGLKKLIRLPTGCGEQNMILFSPNIFVLDYLQSSKKLTDDVKEQLLVNLRTGYQRELTYRHPDGSYSCFGTRDKHGGSLWLTSFVLKSLSQARRFIEVDEEDLRLSAIWILENQFENGCFQPTGITIHSDIMGGLGDDKQSLAPLTAYVLIALFESGIAQNAEIAVQNALQCLENDPNPGSYALSLYAYASALAKSDVFAQKYLQQLVERAHNRGSHMYWETKSKSYNSKSLNVEIAGYYILAQAELKGVNSTSDVLPVVRWLAKQRNSNGGFVSTQDTVVALQALARYESFMSGDPLDMGLVLEADGLVKGFKLNEDNKLLTQSIQIPELPAVVDLQAVGDGCSLVQFSLRYNTEKISGNNAFDLTVNSSFKGSRRCNGPKISICMRYKVPKQTSNMIVLFVKMASGYMPDEWSLLALQNDVKVQLKRYEIIDNTVNLYFDELTNDQVCFHLFVKNEMEVEDIKPASVTICDYYQPELQVTKEYSIPTTCSQNELDKRFEITPLISVAGGEEFDVRPTFQSESIETIGTTKSTHQIIIDGETDSISDGDRVMTTHGIVVLDDFSRTNFSSDEEDDSLRSGTAVETNSETSYFPDHTVTPDTDNFSKRKRRTVTEEVDKAEESNVFSNFIDSDHDLDVPDGIEGNIPEYVLPPNIETQIQDASAPLDCPTCTDEFPENFNELYCNSSFVIRAIVREGNNLTVKILQDLSFPHKQPRQIKKFATFEYNEHCDCLQLYKKGNILIVVSNDTTLWFSKKGKHHIILNHQVNIISTNSKVEQPAEIFRSKNSCRPELPHV